MYVMNSKWVVGTCVHEGLSACVLEEGGEGELGAWGGEGVCDIGGLSYISIHGGGGAWDSSVATHHSTNRSMTLPPQPQ